jgi:hypothetical protein
MATKTTPPTGFPSRIHQAAVVSRSSNPENRCSVLLFRTAIASAFRWPITTTSFLLLDLG